MTFTEKVLFVVVALLVAAVISVVGNRAMPAPASYVVASAVGIVIGYYCDKLWRRWNK